MKKTILMLLGIVLFTSCEKEDPCVPYTFNLVDGDIINVTHTNSRPNGNSYNEPIDFGFNVSARFEGCLTSTGWLYNTGNEFEPFGQTKGKVIWRRNDNDDDKYIVLEGRGYEIESESGSKLIAKFGNDLTLTITK